MPETITIVGAGMMGTALCWPLCDNGHTVRLVGTPLDEEIIHSIRKTGVHPKLERKIPATVMTFLCDELPGALRGAGVVVNGVSSFGTDWFVEMVAPRLVPGVPVIAVTKGLHVLPDGDVQPLPDFIAERLPAGMHEKVSLNAIAGPCIAHELAVRRQTCVVFTGHDLSILRSLKSVFATRYYHIRMSTDLKELEICAALKNGYALGIGIAVGMFDKSGSDGLAQMYNPQAALFAQSCLEMRLLIKALGGKEEHASWLPGAGDLYVTVYGGRTLRLGRLLGQGFSMAQALDQMAGVTLESVEIITRLAGALLVLEGRGLVQSGQFPFLQFLDGVINHDEPVAFPWDRFCLV